MVLTQFLVKLTQIQSLQKMPRIKPCPCLYIYHQQKQAGIMYVLSQAKLVRNFAYTQQAIPPIWLKKFKSRLARTLLYFGNRALFLEILRREIKRHVNRANKLGLKPAIRLNGTSDIQFETVRYSVNGEEFTLFTEFSDVQFYDYTKIPNRKRVPSNLHLTFSLAEDNQDEAVEAFESGLNVAVVFNVKRGKELPSTFILRGFKTISGKVFDGDTTDYRPDDPKNSFIGLRAKGKAIGDKSGFVYDA